ncbi:MAG: hypothetical protein ASARMPREDX12_002339 [Alectoria sarmentosa]|nr:MAG: hypothetical protein ASARMPRED_007251 [Alectoria sarmentosa]CAD6586332.1 MAG: hypothetical protein ASARMPREDX12_002339 [Alectoria sarmentosa]
MSRNAQPDQKLANNQQKEDSQGQGFDEMEIDNNKNDGELDSKLMEATKKMGIKPPNEVKNDLNWAQIYSHKYWQSSGPSSSRQ